MIIIFNLNLQSHIFCSWMKFINLFVNNFLKKYFQLKLGKYEVKVFIVDIKNKMTFKEM